MSKTRALALLVPYLAVLFYLTLIWHSDLRPVHRLHLKPFGSVVHYVRDATYWWRHPNEGPYLYNIARGLVVNIVGNVAVFVPFGFLLPSLLKQRTSVWQALFAGAFLSTLIETIQYFSRRRIADVDDVLLNTIGTLAGYLCAYCLDRRLRAPEARQIETRPTAPVA